MLHSRSVVFSTKQIHAVLLFGSDTLKLSLLSLKSLE